MHAVIMAGGEGTRLRPLTCDIPKPMARLCGRPVMEYILDLLKLYNFKHCHITLRYLPNVIKDHFPDNTYKDMELDFVLEDKPLGTAGSVKNAAGGIDSDILVISGDAITDFDLSAAVETHRKNNAAATIVVCRVADPREYGLVDFDESGRVTGFIEKPNFAQAVTDTANTGIYIISPRALSLIPEGRAFDFAKDLFPLLLEKGLPIFAHEAKGYWCDIGDLSTYVRCQQEMMSGKVKCDLPRQVMEGVFVKGALPSGDYVINPPCYIGEDVVIGEGSVIGPNTVLDDRCYVGHRASVKSSVVLPSGYVGNRASLSGALLCPGASVKSGASVFEGAVVGSGTVVGEQATVYPRVSIWPHKVVENGAIVRENVQFGIARLAIFDDDGISGETGVEITPEFCARVGAAAASMKIGKRIGVACSGEKVAEALKMALVSGILSAGSQVFDFGKGFEAMLNYSLTFCDLPMGIFVQSGQNSRIKIIISGGLPATRPIERELEAYMARGQFARCSWDAYRERVNMEGIRQIYMQHLMSLAPNGLNGMSVLLKSANREAEKVLSQVLIRLGCGITHGLKIHIGEAGTRLAVVDEREGYIWPERVLGLCCLPAFERGEDVALPYNAPKAIDEVARLYGRRVLRYLNCPADNSDKDARQLAKTQLWARDGLMCAVILLNYMKEKGMSFSKLLSMVPSFAVVKRTVKCEDNPGKIIKMLCSRESIENRGNISAAEGVGIKAGQGTVLVCPTKRGRALVLFAEARDFETASELCDGFEKMLNSERF